jgi:ubiquinol-cytochrome c reductase cytochrome b subunit
LILLHENGSNNPLGLGASKIKFSPYLWFKDIVYWLFMAIVISFFLFYEPDYWGHPDNFNSADPLVTPSSIVPEFYFLPYYAILRAIPNKLGGVVAMVSAIVILLTISRTSTKKPKSSKWKSLQGFLFWSFTANFIFLGWLGNHPASEPYILLAEISTLFYFIYFIQLTLIN